MIVVNGKILMMIKHDCQNIIMNDILMITLIRIAHRKEVY